MRQQKVSNQTNVRDVKTISVSDLEDVGMPIHLARWIVNCRNLPDGRADIERAARFVEYRRLDADDTRVLEKAWARLSKAAISSDALVCLFGRLPDSPVADPKAWLIGATAIDAGEHRRRNRDAQRHVAALVKFVDVTSLESLNADALETSPQARAAYIDFIGSRVDFVSRLNALNRLLGLVNPKARLLGSQFAARDGKMQNYRRLIADLNRFLKTPQHSALVAIANINCPAHPVLANSIAHVWNRIAKDNLLDF